MDVEPPLAMTLTRTEARVLLAPDWVARAAAGAAKGADQRWMLRQPRAVRRSFHHAVFVEGGGARIAQERWLLLAPDAVRHAYVEQVLDPS